MIFLDEEGFSLFNPVESKLFEAKSNMLLALSSGSQWFGNLVTMSWWNDLWLNEGFATYMQYTSLQAVYPKLDIVSLTFATPPYTRVQFIFNRVELHGTSCLGLQDNLFLSVRFRAMDSDALNSSHAVSTEVDAPEQVQEMFDSVSYEKVHFLL